MPWTLFYAASVGQWQIWKGGVLIGTANIEANARLIAAAPALLAALKEWLAADEHYLAIDAPGGRRLDRLCFAKDTAKAAIAQATEGQ